MNQETTHQNRRYIKQFRYRNNEFLQDLQRKAKLAYNLIEEVVNKATEKAVIVTKEDSVVQRIIKNDLDSVWHSINQINLQINKLRFAKQRNRKKVDKDYSVQRKTNGEHPIEEEINASHFLKQPKTWDTETNSDNSTDNNQRPTSQQDSE